MPVLNTAKKVYAGSTTAKKVYQGSTLVWSESGPAWSPNSLAGLTVWHTAEDYTPGSWPNRGSGPDPSFVGSPPPAIAAASLNGLPVVRFSYNEGRLRGTGMIPTTESDLTVIYVTRMVGPNVGRVFTNPYPPFNFLVGTHTSGEPQMYDNGWVGNNYSYAAIPTPWRMYGAVCTFTPRLSSFYMDGTFRASHNLSNGHDPGYNLSGYDPTLTQETCDCEVAEFIAYSRALPENERQQVEGYLKTKWGV